MCLDLVEKSMRPARFKCKPDVRLGGNEKHGALTWRREPLPMSCRQLGRQAQHDRAPVRHHELVAANAEVAPSIEDRGIDQAYIDLTELPGAARANVCAINPDTMMHNAAHVVARDAIL